MTSIAVNNKNYGSLYKLSKAYTNTVDTGLTGVRIAASATRVTAKVVDVAYRYGALHLLAGVYIAGAVANQFQSTDEPGCLSKCQLLTNAVNGAAQLAAPVVTAAAQMAWNGITYSISNPCEACETVKAVVKTGVQGITLASSAYLAAKGYQKTKETNKFYAKALCAAGVAGMAISFVDPCTTIKLAANAAQTSLPYIARGASAVGNAASSVAEFSSSCVATAVNVASTVGSAASSFVNMTRNLFA